MTCFVTDEKALKSVPLVVLYRTERARSYEQADVERIVDNGSDGSAKQLLWPTITHVGSTGTPSGRVASTWTRLGLGERWVVAWSDGKGGGWKVWVMASRFRGRQLDD